MFRRRALLFFLISAMNFILIPMAAASSLFEPLPIGISYLPMMRFFDPLTESASVPYANNWKLQFNQSYSSNYAYDSLPKGTLLVDGEVYTADFMIKKSPFRDVEVSLRMPLNWIGSGFMDRGIRVMHQATGFRNGGREFRPANRFAYFYNPGWNASSGWQLGNITLSSRMHMLRNRQFNMAGLAAVKVPTASRRQGLGSGTVDVAAGVALSQQYGDWFAHLNGWYIHPASKHHASPFIQNYMRGAAVVGWRFVEHYSLVTQVQGGSSPYQRPLPQQLSDRPLIVGVGLRGETLNGMGWSLTFVEDLTFYSTQDFSIVVGFNWD